MLPEDENVPLIVRNGWTYANQRDPQPPYSATMRPEHVRMSTQIAEQFDSRCSSEHFYGYVVPYDYMSIRSPKTYKFEARWTFEYVDDGRPPEVVRKEITDALVGEMIAEVSLLAGSQIIFPCVVGLAGLHVDPHTFEPVARFHIIYYSSPSRMVPPIDMANAPPVFA